MTVGVTVTVMPVGVAMGVATGVAVACDRMLQLATTWIVCIYGILICIAYYIVFKM